MNIDKITYESIYSVRFHDHRQVMMDIDELFKISLNTYAITLSLLELPVSYDFTKRVNKKFLMNELIKNYMHFVKSSEYQIVFYQNISIENKTKNQLIKKLENIFEIKILKDVKIFSDLIRSYESRESACVEIIDTFLANKSEKNFKKIKKFLKHEGLDYLFAEYVEDISKKMDMLLA
jgi:hypothetical protein